MLSIHGVHEWEVVPGLQDTGGQNVFVNQFSAALSKFGYKITIVNRGGYAHPRTGLLQKGLHYKDQNQRILYLDDGVGKFVRKEEMFDHFPQLVESLTDFLETDGAPVNMIISHYWDAGTVGCMLKEKLEADIDHVWVPHSLGMVKKRNTPPDAWEDLRIAERIEFEKEVLQKLVCIAATSSIIKESAKNDYGFSGKVLWLPPCVDQERYYPYDVKASDPVWSFLSKLAGLTAKEIQGRKIITEISRTDETKQKDILIKSFSQLLNDHPDAFLVVAIDDTNQNLSAELKKLIEDCGISPNTAAVGSIWDLLPALYAISDIYCTPSIMEGFGMAVQEAAATKVPVISSDLVPFVTEYLAPDKRRKVELASGSEVIIGDGAIIISPGDIDGFAYAMDLLLTDQDLRQKMGDFAYQATIPYFTWDHIVGDFDRELKNKL